MLLYEVEYYTKNYINIVPLRASSPKEAAEKVTKKECQRLKKKSKKANVIVVVAYSSLANNRCYYYQTIESDKTDEV